MARDKVDTILLWLDLEMTGLDPAHDTILEIASLITDNDLNLIEMGPALVIHQSDEIQSQLIYKNISRILRQIFAK